MSGRHRRERAPHEQDQDDAAEREARRVLQRTSRHIGGTVQEGRNDDPSDPTLVELIGQLREEARRGQVEGCGHLRGPQPAFINAWDHPRVLRCEACQYSQPPLIGDDDRRCDACGNVDPTGIWPAQIAMGPVLVSFGRCDDCTPEHVKSGPRF